MAAETKKKYKEDDRICLIAEISCSTEISGITDKQFVFNPKVNKLSMLNINLNDSRLKDGCKIKFKPDGSDKYTYEFPLVEENRAAEFLSLILFFEKGVNNAINWDTSFDINSCKLGKPINKTCSVPFDSDKYGFIKVFAAAVGTDKDNIPLTSAQMLPSTFVKFGVGGIVDDAKKFIDKAGDWFKKKF